ncbi:MAG: insulinase family protein [Candidatus Zambryskibacteria bacterium]|nr:insulinase family protein [Candidatus Zambryskibacteria bacterium]
MKFKKLTLPNGLRIIAVQTKGNPSAMTMVSVETGSNYETKAENGLSHFLEHMCFKGTPKRPKASDIAKELDALGAENNAFTSNEWTSYYAKASKKHFTKLCEIISDMYLNPTLPAKDLEIERGVILQEISMYEDLPQRKVWDVLYKLLYKDTPAGRTILGPAENIKKFTRSDFINYRNKHYVPNKTIVVVAGDFDAGKMLTEVKKYFSKVKSGKRLSKLPVVRKQNKPALLVEQKRTDQTHMVLAFHTFSARDKRSPTLEVIAEILGQGMSSRLFHKLRDEMGACYYVRAFTDEYTDHGLLAITVGINASRAKEVIEVLLNECDKLRHIPVPKEELAKAKEHYVGHLFMNLETTDNVARFYNQQEILISKLKKPQEIEKEIRKVTAKNIMNVAKDIFRNNKLNLAIVGNISDTKRIKKAISFK